MAVDGKSGDWDEKSINALYRAWQRSRDGIDYRHYRPIIQAAREIARRSAREAKEMEQRMELIRAEARAQVLDQHLPDEVAVGEYAEATPAGRPSALQRAIETAGSSIWQAIAGFFDSISPKQWVPVAVTAALVVAVVPLVIDSGPDDLYRNLSAQTGVLSGDSTGVSRELDRLGEFQHGFSSSDSEYARAFSAGVIFTNLIGLANQPDTAQREKSINDLEQLTGQSLGLPALQPDDPSESLTALGDRLQRYYSEDGYWPVFVFGQWVETGYLLSRLALEDGDNGQSIDALSDLLSDKDEVTALLTRSDLYAPRLDADLGKLAGAMDDDRIDQRELDQLGNVFLKLRTVESRQ